MAQDYVARSCPSEAHGCVACPLTAPPDLQMARSSPEMSAHWGQDGVLDQRERPRLTRRSSITVLVLLRMNQSHSTWQLSVPGLLQGSRSAVPPPWPNRASPTGNLTVDARHSHLHNCDFIPTHEQA